MAGLAACGGTDDEATTTTTTTAEDGGGGGSDPTLEVGAQDDLTFDQDSYEVESGDVAVTYVNDGTVAHTLLIEGVEGFKLAVGDVDTGTVTLDPGTYQMYCDIPGHEAAGMVAELTVS